MNILIYGAGAIGSHIAYCMHSSGYNIFVLARGNHYKAIKSNGLIIKIHNNQKLLSKVTIKESENFHIIKSLKLIESIKLDCIFITVKLKDYNFRLINKIKPFLNKNTAIIPPCTNIPLWWILGNKILAKKFKEKIHNHELLKQNYFKINNIIGMTMWVSAVVEKPGYIKLRHTQRGYPLKAIKRSMISKSENIKKSLEKYSKSPEIKDIFSEVFIKSLNALAFNTVALKYKFNNYELKKSNEALKDIRKIMEEGESILDVLKIDFSQTSNQRINQTLSSSAHTMSMLNDYNNRKEVELKYLWGSFQLVCKCLDVEMKFTEELVKITLKEINY